MTRSAGRDPEHPEDAPPPDAIHDGGMSFFGQRPSSLAPTGLPQGELLGSFSNYQDAQKVVDHLSDEQFDVQQVSIVGHDLSSVERVTGRLSYPRVAMLSAAQGAMFGLFFGVILAMFGGSGWGLSVLLTVLLGAAFWVILGVVSFAAQRGRRDFTSVSTFVASRYDVVVRGDVAAQARQALQGLNLAGLQRGGFAPAQNRGFGPGQQPGAGQGSGPGHGVGNAPGAPGTGTGQSGQSGLPPYGQPQQYGRPQTGQHQPGPYQDGQPGQPQPGQPQSGQSRQDQGGQSPQDAQAPRYGQPGAPSSVGDEREGTGAQPQHSGQAPVQQPTRAPLGEQDLPDGRPRYGVRVEPEQQGEQQPAQGAEAEKQD